MPYFLSLAFYKKLYTLLFAGIYAVGKRASEKAELVNRRNRGSVRIVVGTNVHVFDLCECAPVQSIIQTKGTENGISGNTNSYNHSTK
jgi:hypothetical protein